MFSGKNDPKTVINDLQVASNGLKLAKTEGSPPKKGMNLSKFGQIMIKCKIKRKMVQKRKNRKKIQQRS